MSTSMDCRPISYIHKNIIKHAVRVAKKTDMIRGKIGAVLFTNSMHIITASCNFVVMGYADKGVLSIHAERFLLAKVLKLKAIERYGKSNLNILVVRYKPSQTLLANAKPCPKCESLLKRFGIRTFYSDSDGSIVQLPIET